MGDETPPKKKGKSRKKLIESDEEPEEEDELPKKRGKGKKKVIESEDEDESEDEMPKKRGGKKKQEEEKKSKDKKKGGLANLLGKRGAAKKAEKQMKGLDDTHEEEDGSDDEDNGRRGRRNKKNKEDENKENARVKRARNLDDSFDLNIVALEDLVKCLLKHKDGWPFDRPITKADAPDYHLCVRNPMDLGTVRGKLNDMQYTSNQEVINDIRLVFSNCYSVSIPLIAIWPHIPQFSTTWRMQRSMAVLRGWRSTST